MYEYKLKSWGGDAAPQSLDVKKVTAGKCATAKGEQYRILTPNIASLQFEAGFRQQFPFL